MFSWICLGSLEPRAVAAACSLAWIKTFTAVFSSALHCSLEEIRHLIAAEIGESESILLKGITEEERQIFIAIGERMLKNLDEAN